MENRKIFEYNPADQLKSLTETYTKFIDAGRLQYLDALEASRKIQETEFSGRDPGLLDMMEELNDKIAELTAVIKDLNKQKPQKTIKK